MHCPRTVLRCSLCCIKAAVSIQRIAADAPPSVLSGAVQESICVVFRAGKHFYFPAVLHSSPSLPVLRFGGGPAVNHLYVCSICQVEIEALAKRRRIEIDTFIKVCMGRIWR